MNAFPVQLFAASIQALPTSGRPTGIYKKPCLDTVTFTAEGISGDQQADRRVHGGPEKAVHIYPARHYQRLALGFPEIAGQLTAGTLGENLSIEGLDESHVHIGDIWQLGEVLLQVCQPRNPCWKIDERLGVEGIAAYIAEHFLTGWYARVIKAGNANQGENLMLHTRLAGSCSLLAAMQLCAEHRPNPAQLKQLSEMQGIATHWQRKIQQRLNYLSQ